MKVKIILKIKILLLILLNIYISAKRMKKRSHSKNKSPNIFDCTTICKKDSIIVVDSKWSIACNDKNDKVLNFCGIKKKGKDKYICWGSDIPSNSSHDCINSIVDLKKGDDEKEGDSSDEKNDYDKRAILLKYFDLNSEKFYSGFEKSAPLKIFKEICHFEELGNYEKKCQNSKIHFCYSPFTIELTENTHESAELFWQKYNGKDCKESLLHLIQNYNESKVNKILHNQRIRVFLEPFTPKDIIKCSLKCKEKYPLEFDNDKYETNLKKSFPDHSLICNSNEEKVIKNFNLLNVFVIKENMCIESKESSKNGIPPPHIRDIVKIKNYIDFEILK
jgi:hypothetical protein